MLRFAQDVEPFSFPLSRCPAVPLSHVPAYPLTRFLAIFHPAC
jgi:hypothetical protein